MTRNFLKDALGLGALLWLTGYVAGIVLFFLVPPALIGWIIMPLATALTLWVALRVISGPGFGHYLAVALAWLAIAVAGDYFFIVRLLHPADGYYKLDVYLYYALTLILPLAAGAWRLSRAQP